MGQKGALLNQFNYSEKSVYCTSRLFKVLFEIRVPALVEAVTRLLYVPRYRLCLLSLFRSILITFCSNSF